MRYQVFFTNRFKSNYKLIQKRGYNILLLDEVIERLANCEVLERRFNDHELSGKYSGLRECHIRPDWLLIYCYDEYTNRLMLFQTGTHADLLNM